MGAPRVAVVGCGWIAEHCHLPGYRNAGADIVAVADAVRQRATAAALAFEVPNVYDDWQTMLEEQRPDVVSVCVPNVFHAPVALAAIEAGAHVLCEKPVATSVADAEEMFAAAKRKGVLLMAGQNQRFRPVNEAIKAAIDRGAFGEIYHAEASYVRRLGIPNWGSFTMKAASFGGALCDVGVHVMDLALWFMGNPRPVEVSAQTEARFGTRPEIAALRGNAWDPAKFDVEDFASAYVRFDNGAILALQASWASHIEAEHEHVRVLGTHAGAINNPPVIFSLRDGKAVNEALDLPRVSGWIEEVAHFLDAVAGKVEPRVKPEETLNVQRMINAAYESAAQRRAVRV